MNELKFFEAVNMIDDDLVRESDEVSADTAAVSDERENIVVSGVENYSRHRFYRLAVIASVFLLVAGIGAGGAYMLSNRKAAPPDNSDIQAETVVTTERLTEDDEETATTATMKDEIESKKKKSEKEVYDKKENKKTSEKSADEKAPSAEDDKDVTVKAADGGTYPVSASSKKNTTTKTAASKTAAKTTTVRTTTPPPVEKNSVRMTLKDVMTLSTKGDALTWSDFDPYIGEDIGSGIYIYKYNITYGYTLYVMGVPPKAPDKIWLYKGTDAPMDSEHIDIRYYDINEFLNSDQALNDKEMLYKEIHQDSVSRIQVTSSSGKRTELSYPEVKTMVRLLKERDLLRKDGSYDVLSLNRYDINISYYGAGPLQQRETNISIIGNYLIINGDSYICKGDSDNINRFLYSVTNRETPGTVDIGNGEVWCWNNFMDSNISLHDYYDKIIISAFPDIVFTWNGMNESGVMLERNGKEIITLGGMPLWSAFFTDLNGDGYPEICSSLSIGSGIVDTRVGVYDIRNNKLYELQGRNEEIDYWLYMENGELFVNKQSSNTGWGQGISQGEKGKLAIENDALVFKPV